MRTFYVNGNQVQKSYHCPAGLGGCEAFKFLQSVPKLQTRYTVHDAFNIDIFAATKFPYKVDLIGKKINELCNDCPMGKQAFVRLKQREL